MDQCAIFAVYGEWILHVPGRERTKYARSFCYFSLEFEGGDLLLPSAPETGIASASALRLCFLSRTHARTHASILRPCWILSRTAFCPCSLSEGYRIEQVAASVVHFFVLHYQRYTQVYQMTETRCSLSVCHMSHVTCH